MAKEVFWAWPSILTYKNNGRFFVNYTTTDGGQLKTVVAKYKTSIGDLDQASPEEKNVLEFDQPDDTHNAGDLSFGPDGYIYISSGDGGPPGDPFGRGQDRSSLLRKILRIDVDGDEPYRIPPDNPFVGEEGIREEIWAYGLRNPFRFGFDRVSGRLFTGDVGEARYEEVDIIIKGGNYGWSRLEGLHYYPSELIPCDTTGLIPPIFEYDRRKIKAAVIGGRVYRGSQPTGLWGAYIFADFVSGHIWALEEMSGGIWERRELLKVVFFRLHLERTRRGNSTWLTW